MSNIELWLRLAHAPGIGPQTIQKLLHSFHDIEHIFAASGDEMAAYGLNPKLPSYLKSTNQEQISKDLSWLAQPGNTIITLENIYYPSMLREINSAPAVLYLRGNPQALDSPMLAMVGSRNATDYGLATAFQMSHHLAEYGFTCVSGLALGIDAAAHRGALDHAGGRTIAVLGAGHDHIYPRIHKTLYEKIIASSGAVISEYPPSDRVSANKFPRRNRIISGLCLGTIVVEASMRSGSLITARYALEQDREVFAVPGSIHCTVAKGCNSLIKQGACLVESAEDIISSLPEWVQSIRPVPHAAASSPISSDSCAGEYAELVALLSDQPLAIDQLSLKSGLTAAQVSSILVQLEMKGIIYQPGMGLYARSPLRSS